MTVEPRLGGLKVRIFALIIQPSCFIKVTRQAQESVCSLLLPVGVSAPGSLDVSIKTLLLSASGGNLVGGAQPLIASAASGWGESRQGLCQGLHVADSQWGHVY